MTQKKPKDSSFYERFKFDKELYDSIFSKGYRTEKAILYLTTLVKAVLPQDSPTPKIKKQKPQNEALNRIKDSYKKEEIKQTKKTPPTKTEVESPKSEIESTQPSSLKQTIPKIKVAASKNKVSENPAKKIISKPPVPNKSTTKEIVPPSKKIKFKTFLNNMKLVLNYLNPLSKTKPEELKTTKLDDSLKRLKEREKKIKELFDKNKGKLS